MKELNPSRPEIVNPPNLEILTFTGIDSLQIMDAVAAVSASYPKVEFGILVGSHNGEASYREFPSLGIVDYYKVASSELGLRLALHLYGRYSRDIMAGRITDELLDLCAGFSRIQINAREYDNHCIGEFADRVSCPRIILQRCREHDNSGALFHPKVEYVFDSLGGQGSEGFADWPEPVRYSTSHGYASGLNAHNIQRALGFVASFSDYKIWFDMADGVRSDDDWLDMNKVRAVCETVFGYPLSPQAE